MTPEEAFLSTPLGYATPTQLAEARQYARALAEKNAAREEVENSTGALGHVVRSATAGTLAAKAGGAERGLNNLQAKAFAGDGGDAPPEQQMAAAAKGAPPAASALASMAAAQQNPNHPMYGLMAGEMPMGLSPRDMVEMVSAGIPLQRIMALSQMAQPQYLTDPVSGTQYAVFANGRAVPIGQNFGERGQFEMGDMKIPTVTYRDEKGKPNIKFNIPKSEDGSDFANPRSSEGGRSPNEMPPSGFGPTIDRLRMNKVYAEAAKKGAEATAQKFGETRGELPAQAIKEGLASYGVLNDLGTMKEAYSRGNIQGGPFAPHLNTIRSIGAQLFPDSNLANLTRDADVIDKINFGLATKIVREITARGTQMEIVLGMRNNPGIGMNNKGAEYMMDLMTQIQIQKQELGRIAARLPEDKAWMWSDIEHDYFQKNPLLSPVTKKPMTGQDAILRDLATLGGLGPGGPNPLTPQGPEIQELLPGGGTRPIK